MAIPVSPDPCPKCGYTVCISGPLTTSGVACPTCGGCGYIKDHPTALFERLACPDCTDGRLTSKYLFYYCMATKMGSCDYEQRVPLLI